MTASVSPPQPARRSLVYALFAAILAVLIGVLPALSTSSAAAAATPSPTPTAPTGPAHLTVAPQNGGLLTSGQALAVSVALTAGAAPIASASVTVQLGTTPLPDRAAVDAWLTDPRADATPTVLGSVDLGQFTPGEQNVGVLRLDPSDPALPALAPGVYPVVASTTSPSGSLTAASVVVVPGASSASVGVIVPITAPGLTSGLLTADELATLTAPTGELTAVLGGVQGTTAILAIDPAIPASIRALGSAAPATAWNWLLTLEGLPNDRFALQFGDADPAAQVAAGLPTPLRVTSLAPFLTPANFTVPLPIHTPTPDPSPSPSPSPSPTSPGTTLPTLEELLDVGGPAATIYWPATATGEIVSTLGADGSWTLLSSAAVSGATGARATAGSAPVLVADDGLSAALSRAASENAVVLRANALAEASALEYFAVAGGGTHLVTIARHRVTSAVALRSAIDNVGRTPGATPADLATLLSSPAAAVQVTGAAPDAARVAAVSPLLDGESAISAFATVLADPTVLTGRERAQMLQLLGFGWDPQTDAWASALRAHADQTTQTLASVELLPTSTIQLVSADASLPVYVKNDLPYPVTVVLHADADDLRLTVDATTTVEIGPSQSVRATLPVKARVGSGTVNIALSLTSTSGVPVGPDRMLEVTVRADWEGIGIVVLSTLAVGFLALGVVRTVLRLRARRAGASASADAATNDPEADSPETPAAADVDLTDDAPAPPPADGDSP